MSNLAEFAEEMLIVELAERQRALLERHELTMRLSGIYMHPPEGLTPEQRETIGQAADLIGAIDE